MFLIFGFRARSKVLARLLLVCAACTQPAAQTIYQRVRWFTLFFIPVIPISRQYRMQCAMCGNVYSLTKADADRLVGEATAAAATSGPAPAPLDGSHEAIAAE